jgi:hypothetical protein
MADLHDCFHKQDGNPQCAFEQADVQANDCQPPGAMLYSFRIKNVKRNPLPAWDDLRTGKICLSHRDIVEIVRFILREKGS